MKFTAKDCDNVYGSSCSVSNKGAWWYDHCHDYNLNGPHLIGSVWKWLTTWNLHQAISCCRYFICIC